MIDKTETTEEQKARWDRQRPVIAILLASSCFGHEVCLHPPCSCAQAILDGIVEQTTANSEKQK